jgi:non-homologous end joining protein Ku
MTRPIASYRSGFQLNLGLLSVPVSLYAVIPSSKGKERRTLCATHKVPIRQAYLCPEDEELNPETVKAIEVTKGNYVIPEVEEPEEIPADDGISFVAVPTEDMEHATIATDKLYYLQPHVTGVKAWEILYRLASQNKLTLIGQAALKANSRKIYRLTVFNDYLVLQALEFPEHIREAPDRDSVIIEKKLMDQAKQVLSAIEVPWEKVDVTDEGLRRFQALTEAGERIHVGPTTTDKQGEPIDLMEALKQSVEATKRKAS